MALLEFADETTAVDEFLERYSDGLPVVLPTPERVEAMLAGTARDPDEVLGAVMPSGTLATVRDVAINAVLAGAPPAVLPLALAAVEALVDERFNLNGVQSTTHCAAVLVIVSGPLAERAGMNAGTNVLGNGNRANLALARTIRLVMTNIGDGVPGRTDMSVQGTPAKIAFCLAERLDVDLWPALAQREGAPAGATTVTVVAADGPHTVCDHRSASPERLLANVADGMRSLITMNACTPGWMALILAPQHARVIARAGWGVEQIQGFLFERARNSLARLREAGEFDEQRTMMHFKRFGAPEDPNAAMPVIEAPDRLIVAIAGGDSGGFSSLVPTWLASTPQFRIVA